FDTQYRGRAGLARRYTMAQTRHWRWILPALAGLALCGFLLYGAASDRLGSGGVRRDARVAPSACAGNAPRDIAEHADDEREPLVVGHLRLELLRTRVRVGGGLGQSHLRASAW